MPSLNRKSTTGRKKADAGIGVVGPLTVSDLDEIMEPKSPETSITSLKGIRDSHHMIAKYVALGFKDFQVSAITGYTAARISVLKKDPAFQELLEFYRQDDTEAFRDLQIRMNMIAMDGLEELSFRLNSEQVAEINTAALLDVVTRMLDRTGNGPVTKNLNVNANVDVNEIEAMKNELRQKEKVSRITESQNSDEANQVIDLRPKSLEGPVPGAEEESAESEES